MLAEVKEQDEGVRFLRRVATRDFASPLMLVGDEGVGRRFSVLQLAKEVFCVANQEPGCRCFSCRQIDEGTHTDLTIVTVAEGKDIGVDQIRAVVEAADAFPSVAPLKFFLVDGADRMTPAAANALLKTLEEPPATARFFLLAENDTRVIPTIRSRCGRVRYRRLSEGFVVESVRQFESDSTKALVYARMSEGSVGRAIRFWGSGKLGLRDRVLALLNAGVRKDLPSVFSIVDNLDKELPVGLKILDQLLHDLLMTRHDPTRMIYIDIAPSLTKLWEQLPDGTWRKMITGLRGLLARMRGPRLNLPFHVQSLFVDVFFGS